MTARAASSFLLSALCLPFLVSPSAAGPWSLARGEYGSELTAGLYSTTSFYDAAGTRTSVNSRFEARDLSWLNEIGWKKRLSVLLGLAGRSVTGINGASTFQTSQTDLTELTLGLKGNLMNARQALAIEAEWTAPLGYDRELTTVASAGLPSGARRPLLGDGRQRLGAQLEWGTGLASAGFVQASVGGFYRYDHFGQDSFPSAYVAPGPNGNTVIPNYYLVHSSASFFTMGADAGWWVRSNLLLGGRYRGQSVIASSGGSDNKNLEPDAVRHLVGPFLLLRVDDRLDLSAGTLSTASGKSTDHLNQVWVALGFKQTHLNRLQGFLGGTRP